MGARVHKKSIFLIMVFLLTLICPIKLSVFAASYLTVKSQLLSGLECDRSIYYGIQHCGKLTDNANVLIVDPNDQRVHFQTVFPINSQGVECNSVNPQNKNSTSNCPDPYPFERVGDMLLRYKEQGGVAIINTDYFGIQNNDHGAQGLAVRASERLDGQQHGVTNNLAVSAPSLAVSPSNNVIIGFPENQEFIESHLSDVYFNTVGGGPLIVQDGQVIQSPCQQFYSKYVCDKPSQSAAGITRDNRLILVTAKMNAEELARFLVDNYQVVTAMKFDGGGSARMAWLDSDEALQTYGATTENRKVAEGLIVFSQQIEPQVTVAPPMVNPPDPITEPPIPTEKVVGIPETGQESGFWDEILKFLGSSGKHEVDGFGIGSSAHLRLGIAGLPRAYDEQKELGVRWTREEIPWSEVEESPGNFQWQYGNRDFDGMLKKAKQRGINVIALLTYGPNPIYPFAANEELLSRWKAYVQAVVDRFGNQIDYWEIGNEPNSRFFWGKVVAPGTDMSVVPDPKFFAQMLSSAYDIIKKADADDVVILGGLILITDGECVTNPFVYLGEIYKADVWKKFDAIGYHPYRGASPEERIDRGKAHDLNTGGCLDVQRKGSLVEDVRALQGLAKQFGKKPIWITEIGWGQEWLNIRAGERGVDPDSVEADYLIRTYVPLLSESSVEKVIWYTQIPDNQNENFVLDQPGKLALKNLAQILTGSQPLGQFQGQNDRGNPEDDDAYEYRFEKDNQQIVVLWKARGGDEPRDVTINDLTGTTVRVYDSQTADLTPNSGKELEIKDGTVKVWLTERPQFLIAQTPGWIDGIEQKLQEQWDAWWQAQQKKLAQWWEEQQKKAEQKVEDWLEQQQKKFEAWLERRLQEWADQLQKQLEQEMIQCCGSLALPMGVVGGVLWSKRKKPTR